MGGKAQSLNSVKLEILTFTCQKFLDEEGGSSMYGKFGAKLSSGAMSMGKKAAQSETGRKAGRAAMKGACDSARDDMMNRYFPGEEPTSPTAKGPAKPEAPAAASSTKPKQESSSSYSASSTATVSGGQEWSSARPPKPSILDKFKISKGSSSAKPHPRPIRDPKKKVYKHRLAQSADWDRLPMAQALYNFKSEMKCDLEFRKGQVIYVITRTDTQHDWWEGRIEDRVGIFPANYVKMMS